MLVCPMPHGTKWSKGQLHAGIFGFSLNTGWFLNFGIHHGSNSQNSLTGTTIKWRTVLPTREEHILKFAINRFCCWFGRIFVWIHWANIFKFITKVEQKTDYTTTPSSSSFGIWVQAGLRPHHSEILIVLCTGNVSLFSRIHIQLKTQTSSQ